MKMILDPGESLRQAVAADRLSHAQKGSLLDFLAVANEAARNKRSQEEWRESYAQLLRHFTSREVTFP